MPGWGVAETKRRRIDRSATPRTRTLMTATRIGEQSRRLVAHRPLLWLRGVRRRRRRLRYAWERAVCRWLDLARAPVNDHRVGVGAVVLLAKLRQMQPAEDPLRRLPLLQDLLLLGRVIRRIGCARAVATRARNSPRHPASVVYALDVEPLCLLLEHQRPVAGRPGRHRVRLLGRGPLDLALLLLVARARIGVPSRGTETSARGRRKVSHGDDL